MCSASLILRKKYKTVLQEGRWLWVPESFSVRNIQSEFEQSQTVLIQEVQSEGVRGARTNGKNADNNINYWTELLNY